MRYKIALSFVCCLIVLCGGCGGGLSRSTAEGLIRERTTGTVTVPMYTRVETKQLLDADHTEGGLLYRLGYLSCETVPGSVDTTNPYFPLVTPERCRLVLTDKGSKTGWEMDFDPQHPTAPTRITVPVAQTELVEVTGVTENGNTAAATFTWRQRPLNDVGEALGYGQIKTGTASFQKFDDGWRLMSY